MNESEGSKGANKEACKNGIDTARAGAGYFLSIKGRPEFTPSEYVSFRGLTLSEAQRLLPAEWVRWVQDLQTSSSEHVRRRAASAPTMTVDDIYNFYKSRIIDYHELGILEESSQQVVSGGHQLASLLQQRNSTYLWLLLPYLLVIGIVVSYASVSHVVSDSTPKSHHNDDICIGLYVPRRERLA